MKLAVVFLCLKPFVLSAIDNDTFIESLLGGYDIKAARPQHLTFCPDNWVVFRGSCYYFHRTEQSFTEAQHACLQLNSNLAQIDSVAESQFIKDFLNHQTPVIDWWIGLSDDDIEGIWKWVGSGDNPSSFTDWYPGEPNNAGSGHNEDCVSLDQYRHWQWTDYACSNPYYSICEMQGETSGPEVVG